LQYGRTVNDNHSFHRQENLLMFQPTCHHDDDALFKLADKFLACDSDEIQIFCIWGHSYEFDGNHNWDRMEHFLDRIAGKSDIFYGTNAEVLL
ncbi:MAG: polysaccharide deacetylase, partial [Oscillospiraceae bacterium]|nr:polysaccharide deacetylase [Oscillospiraceae bacterium]